MKRNIQFTAGYQILKDFNLIIDARFGAITLEGLKEYKIQQMNDTNYNIEFDVFVDAREMDLDLLLSEVETYCKFLGEGKAMVSSKRRVLTVISSPHQIAYALQIQKGLKSINQPFEFFTDMGKLMNSLEKPISLEQINEISHSIKEKPLFVWEK